MPTLGRALGDLEGDGLGHGEIVYSSPRKRLGSGRVVPGSGADLRLRSVELPSGFLSIIGERDSVLGSIFAVFSRFFAFDFLPESTCDTRTSAFQWLWHHATQGYSL